MLRSHIKYFKQFRHKDKHTSAPKKYLQSKLVEAEVDEVLDAGQDPMVQVLSRDALEDNTEGRGFQVVMETEVELVPMDGSLKHQQSEHHQMVLHHRTTLFREKLTWDTNHWSNCGMIFNQFKLDLCLLN